MTGGLVGWNNGPISDSAALNPSVTGEASVGSTGIVRKVSGRTAYRLGGLAGTAERATPATDSAVFTNSYWDTDTSGPTFGVGSDDVHDNGMIDGTETPTAGVTVQTTTALKAPTGYTGIFAAWNVTVPGATARAGGPWGPG